MAKTKATGIQARRVWNKSSNCCFVAPYNVISSEDTLENDRVVKKTVIRTVVPSEQHLNLKASDFYLENVLAAGAVDTLKKMNYTEQSLDSVDDLNLSVENLISVIDNTSGVDIKNNENE